MIIRRFLALVSATYSILISSNEEACARRLAIKSRLRVDFNASPLSSEILVANPNSLSNSIGFDSSTVERYLSVSHKKTMGNSKPLDECILIMLTASEEFSVSSELRLRLISDLMYSRRDGKDEIDSESASPISSTNLLNASFSSGSPSVEFKSSDEFSFRKFCTKTSAHVDWEICLYLLSQPMNV